MPTSSPSWTFPSTGTVSVSKRWCQAQGSRIADNRNTALGTLDINRQENWRALEQDKAAREKTFGEGLLKAATGGTGTTGITGDGCWPAGGRGGTGIKRWRRSGAGIFNFWVGKGLAPHQAAGMAAQEVAESGGRPNVPGDYVDGKPQAYGAYQHHADRRALILANTGIAYDEWATNASSARALIGS